MIVDIKVTLWNFLTQVFVIFLYKHFKIRTVDSALFQRDCQATQRVLGE